MEMEILKAYRELCADWLSVSICKYMKEYEYPAGIQTTALLQVQYYFNTSISKNALLKLHFGHNIDRYFVCFWSNKQMRSKTLIQNNCRSV